jgi:hypothetical protein
MSSISCDHDLTLAVGRTDGPRLHDRAEAETITAGTVIAMVTITAP